MINYNVITRLIVYCYELTHYNMIHIIVRLHFGTMHLIALYYEVLNVIEKCHKLF